MTEKIMKNKKGFTLIELLVVIAIIGILSTIAVISLNNARAKARDARRVADVKQMQIALELYNSDIGRYPTAEEFGSGSLFSTSTNGTTTYMQNIPIAPSSDGNCSETQNQFSYTRPSANYYTISYCLGGSVASLPRGPKCVTPDGTENIDCSPGSAGANEVVANNTPFTGCGDTVNYGGESYATVLIGSQCWLARNINIGSRVSGATLQADANSGNFQKYCYGDLGASCDTDGGLYQWHTAMGLPSSCSNHDDSAPCELTYPARGICPIGWHVPSDSEWHSLMLNFDTEAACSGNRYDWPDVGGCASSFNSLIINDSTHFRAIYSGYYGGPLGANYGSRSTGGAWWSSTPFSASEATWNAVSGLYRGWIETGMQRYHFVRTSAMSVRCVLN